MKNYLKMITQPVQGVVLAYLFPLLLLSSCLKDNKSYVNVPAALLMVIQASPDAPAETLSLNSNRVTNLPFDYENYVGYINAFAGNRNVILSNYSSTSIIASDTVHLNANTTYSLFLANTYSKPDLILLQDTIAQPASGKAAIRLVNVSPDAGAVDLAINSTSVLVSNKGYKGYSGFTSVTAGINYNFEIRKSGTTTVLAVIDSVNVKNGATYTIWLHGLAAGSGTTKLNAGMITNAYY